MKKIYLFAMFIMFLSGCQPDKEIIKGSISGFINILDQSTNPLADQSGVEVKLYKDTGFIDSKVTDSNGKYTFEGIPYGTYWIDPEKAGFVPDMYQPSVHHIGGYSPTPANYSLYEIPTYILGIDSISYDTLNYFFSIYVKFNGDTILPPSVYGYIIRVFAGITPEVNKNNSVAVGKGYLSDIDYYHYPGKKRAVVRMNIWELENEARTGTLYLRLYPLAMGQGYYIHDYLPEALGPPSVNTIEFNYNELVGIQ